MFRQVSTVVLVLLAALGSLAVATAEEPTPAPPRNDREVIQGEWEVVTDWEAGGRDTSSFSSRGHIFVFEGARIFPVDGGKRADPMTFSLETSKRPKQIDWTWKIEGITMLVRGVYSLDGDVLRIAGVAGTDRDPPTRPTRLESTKESKHFLWELSRRNSKAKASVNSR